MKATTVTMDASAFDDACRALAEQASDFAPDAVVGIATGGAYVAERMMRDLPDHVTHVDVRLSRPSTQLKKHLSVGTLLRPLPEPVTDRLRVLEVAVRERFVRAERSSGGAAIAALSDAHPELNVLSTAKRVLIVDDTVDSGRTLRAAAELVEHVAAGCETRTAVITSTWRRPPLRPDFCLHERTLVRFFWSFDAIAASDASTTWVKQLEHEHGRLLAADLDETLVTVNTFPRLVRVLPIALLSNGNVRGLVRLAGATMRRKVLGGPHRDFKASVADLARAADQRVLRRWAQKLYRTSVDPQVAALVSGWVGPTLLTTSAPQVAADLFGRLGGFDHAHGSEDAEAGFEENVGRAKVDRMRAAGLAIPAVAISDDPTLDAPLLSHADRSLTVQTDRTILDAATADAAS